MYALATHANSRLTSMLRCPSNPFLGTVDSDCLQLEVIGVRPSTRSVSGTCDRCPVVSTEVGLAALRRDLFCAIGRAGSVGRVP